MKAHHLNLQEILHYGAMGEVEGLAPEVADRLAELCDDQLTTNLLERQVECLKDTINRTALKLQGIADELSI